MAYRFNDVKGIHKHFNCNRLSRELSVIRSKGPMAYG